MPRYDMIQEQAMDRLLCTLPPTATGMLPYSSFEKTPEWEILTKDHSVASVRQTLLRRWTQRLHVVEPKPQVEKQNLNHAYNFCPGCGFKLN